MPAFRLLAVDVDGTLLNSHDRLSPATCQAVRRAIGAGIRVVLATGRRYGRVLHLVEPLGVDVPLITASGALIKHPADHRTLFRAEFSPSLLRDVLDVVAECGHDALLYADTHSEGFEFYYPRRRASSPELAEFLALNRGLGRWCPQLTTDPPEGVFALFAMAARQPMLQLQQRLEAAFPGALYTHVLRSPLYRGYMCEVAPAGVDKWSALCRLAQHWRIEPAAICAVGDDVNDIPMLRGAGLGVAMQNAPEQVKAVADRVAPSNDHDGLAHVVAWLLDE